MKFRTRPAPGDFAVAAAAIILAWLIPAMAAGSGAGSGSGTAVVTVNGAEVCRLSLAGGETLSVPVEGAGGVRLAVEYGGGRARFSSSDCPDHVCVDTGWLSRAGQSAVCLPGRAVLYVEGGGGVDAVVR